MSKATYDALSEVSRRTGMPRAAIVEKLIKDYLATEAPLS